MTDKTIAFSLLDLAPIPEGSSAREAFSHSLDLARLAEEQAEQEPPAEMQDNASFRLLPVIAGVLVLALVVLYFVTR